MDNYDSASDAGPALQQHFEKEESMGHMFPLSGAEARRRYPGGRLRIAAQAVLPEVGGVRVIHDGTHGVQVNNGITRAGGHGRCSFLGGIIGRSLVLRGGWRLQQGAPEVFAC